MVAEILYARYAVGIVAAPAYAVLWAAESIADTATAKKELRKANRLREKHGAMPAYPEYGTRLF
jgi:hypothetical protein